MNCTMIKNLLVLVAMVAVGSASALAGTKGGGGAVKQKVTIRYDATIDGQHIERGDYDLEITSEAEPVLVLRQGKAEVARVPLAAKDRDTKSAYDQIESRTTEDGSREILSFTFKGGLQTFQVKNARGVALAVKP